MRLPIKNIVSLRNLQIARGELERLGLRGVSIEPTELIATDELSAIQYDRLRFVLEHAGIELFENKKDILVQRIKSIIMEIVYNTEEAPVYNLSTHLSEQLQHDYTYMSNLFSERLQITIERYYICHKIERVKEFLAYEDLTVTEIAHRLHYSSVAHLSSQFKKVTGLTPSQFKQRYESRELPPENC